MSRFIIFLFILSISFCQDILITISGNEAKGNFINVEDKYIIFQQVGTVAPIKIPKSSVLKVILDNGDIVYEMGGGASVELNKKYSIIKEKAKLKASFHGNRLSKLYHLGSVGHLPGEMNRKIFSTEKEAKGNGFKPCPACFDLRPELPDYYLEKQLIIGVNASIRNRFEIIYEHPQLDQFTRVLEKTLSQWTETLKGYNYRILIVKDEDPNAFAVAGGNIYVSTGLLGMIEDNAELEFIIAHEIAHVERRHTLRQFKEAQRRNTLAVLATVIVGVGVAAAGGNAEDIAIAAELTAAVSDFSNQFALKGFSREMEQEADIFAQVQLSMMGIKKEKMIYALDKLATNSSKLGYKITANSFSDHPALKSRMNQILNSEFNRFDSPLNIFIVDSNSQGGKIEEIALFKFTSHLIYRVPSSNKSDEDVITLIGSITNNNKVNSYQIEEFKIQSLGVSHIPFQASGLKDIVIGSSSIVDFATTINVKSDLASDLLESIKNKNITPTLKAVRVDIKPGKDGSRIWSKKPIFVTTYIK